MKLISLNVWGGKIFKPLLTFIKKHSKDTDIFCFQEVFNTTSKIQESFGYRTNLYQEISAILPSHQGYLAPALDNYLLGSHQKKYTNFNLSAGLSVFVKKNLRLISSGDFFVYRKRNKFNLGNSNTVPRNVQYISFTHKNKKYTICNLHGIWLENGKQDSHSRIEQSKKIIKFLDKQQGSKILCGDFNLSMNTKSLKILEEDLINLIKNYHIPGTRSKHFHGHEKFADYTFVSPDINIINFQVPDAVVSDHLPMILEFS
ncbi:endonuclease/exonuclease/phosphatase family protein [Candidatus Daviesbacteria bacterium]|nr:endonuclease/exonuclease/phosphatase family protein [Candidatus Daviesbacteria bacterium]